MCKLPSPYSLGAARLFASWTLLTLCALALRALPIDAAAQRIPHPSPYSASEASRHLGRRLHASCAPLQTGAEGERAGSEEPVPVTLSYTPTGTPRTVTIAGTFNGWNKTATNLVRQPAGLTWSVTLKLAPGIYQYRLVVNDTRWITPQDAPRMDDGSGNINALLAVAPQDFARRPGKTGDGAITASGVIHRVSNSSATSIVRGVRYVSREDRGHIDLALRTRRNDVQNCSLLVQDAAAGNASPRRVAMVRKASDLLFDYWRARVSIAPGQPVLHYAFSLKDGQTERLYDSAQTLWTSPHPIRWFELKAMEFPAFETPDWARDAIFYQIFPDRFANGDKKNDPKDVSSWGAQPTGTNRMGGDLAGVLDRMEYLRDLGINALYFNPIFESRSNHGYDTTDYKKIDPRFGTTASLKAITARAHLHGWHVILDGVFNHTGVDFEPFQSLARDGAKSPYRRWYHVRRFPLQIKDGQTTYEGWNGTPWLPKLNVGNPATHDYLLDVAAYWMREAKIDGWRLDAANEVNHDFWKAFRKTVKSVKPDAYIVGEIWPDATDWLQGDEMDSVTSYRWRGTVLDFFAFDKSSPTQFDAALGRIRSDYPPAATAVMFNILGSHDVERVRTLCGGDWQKERQAVAFQMSYPGTPCIYYGDEVGMEGGKDPDNRRAMPWDTKLWDRETLAFYKAAIAVRKEHAVLRRGDFQTVAADDTTGIYAFLRSYKTERALVVFNRSGEMRKALLPIEKVGSLPYRIWMDGNSKPERQGDNLVISLSAHGFAILGH